MVSSPARVPDAIISEIRSRERDGLIELPKLRLEPGMRVKVLQGPLQDQIGLLAALRPHERVLVLLQLLGGQQRVETRTELGRGDQSLYRVPENVTLGRFP
jgi:hypothetical protein